MRTTDKFDLAYKFITNYIIKEEVLGFKNGLGHDGLGGQICCVVWNGLEDAGGAALRAVDGYRLGRQVLQPNLLPATEKETYGFSHRSYRRY